MLENHDVKMVVRFLRENKSLIVEGGTVIDGTGRTPLRKAAVVIKGTRIQRVGKKPISQIEDFRAINAKDKFIIPGLIDCHVHFTTSSRTIRGINASLVQPLPITILESAKRLERLLKSGFTTIRDCGAIDHIDIALKEAVKMNLITGPRILCCGRALAITGGHCATYLTEFDNLPLPHSLAQEVNGCSEVVKAAREEIKAGADWIKIMHGGTDSFGTHPEEPFGEPQFTIDEMKAVCNAMHTINRKVCAHAFSVKTIKNSIVGGVDMVEHGLFIDENCAEMMKERDLPLSTELAFMTLRRDHYEKIAQKDPRFLYDNIINHMMIAVKAGVKLVPGTDFSGKLLGKNALELQCLVNVGLTPMQALLVATKNAAEALGIEAGTIEPGKIADLVIVDGNPLEDIALLQDKTKISMVIKEGNIVNTA